MKVKIGYYNSRWVSDIHTNYMHRKHGHWDWDENTTRFEFFLEKVEDALQALYNATINKILDKRSKILDKRSEQKVSVRIDKWDTWSMDHTLSHIIVPMLKQLSETKQGVPMVEMQDVPDILRIEDKDGEIEMMELRWNHVMREMIWAFEQKTRDDWAGDYYKYEDDPSATFGLKLVWEDKEGSKAHQERMDNGFRLFGKYYESLWT